MIGSNSLAGMLAMVGFTVVGVVLMMFAMVSAVSGAADGSTWEGGLVALMLVVGFCMALRCGLGMLYLAMQFGFEQGVAGRELPKFAKLSAARKEPVSAS